MPEYLAPGVYVEETSFRSKSIEGVGTSTARHSPTPTKRNITWRWTLPARPAFRWSTNTDRMAGNGRPVRG